MSSFALRVIALGYKEVGDLDENNLILAQRQIREGKTSDMTSKNTIKYDFIKMFIEYVINSDYSDPSFGETIMFNTMLNEGLLKKIDYPLK